MKADKQSNIPLVSLHPVFPNVSDKTANNVLIVSPTIMNNDGEVLVSTGQENATNFQIKAIAKKKKTELRHSELFA